MPAVAYTADAVLPTSGQPVGDGGILTEGSWVAAVGPAESLRADADRPWPAVDHELEAGSRSAFPGGRWRDRHIRHSREPPPLTAPAIHASTGERAGQRR